jgi:hypothetical protein
MNERVPVASEQYPPITHCATVPRSTTQLILSSHKKSFFQFPISSPFLLSEKIRNQFHSHFPAVKAQRLARFNVGKVTCV